MVITEIGLKEGRKFEGKFRCTGEKNPKDTEHSPPEKGWLYYESIDDSTVYCISKKQIVYIKTTIV